MNGHVTEAGRARQRVIEQNWKPRNCVWELTLACNLQCDHCGSRAGHVRPDELSLDECLDVVGQLDTAGCEVITLSGGEPTLKKGWDQIARAIADRGIYVNMVTNGVFRDREAAGDIARRARESGMCNVAVSIDGPESIHDRIRGPGTFARTLQAVEHFNAVGLKVAVMTTVSRWNLHALTDVRQLAIDADAHMWRLQLGKPMGSMDDNRAFALDPKHLLELVPMLARLKRAGGIDLRVGDSIGYYGPHDKVLRGRGWRGRAECWKGCQAGMQAIGIEADGGVKGCLSLQAKWGDQGDPFIEGNLRESSVEEIWHRPGVFAFNREFTTDQLTGNCQACRYDSLCRGGARCVSSAVSGLLTEDPYCYYDVASRAGVGWRPGVKRSAAAAAVVLSLGAAACQSDDDDPPAAAADVSSTSGEAGAGDAGLSGDARPLDTDASISAEYGVEPRVDAAASVDYGVEPRTDAAIGVDYGVEPRTDAAIGVDYGVEPRTDAAIGVDYGVEPRTDAAIGVDYGVEPRVDAAIGVDYGVEPRTDAAIGVDYGVEPEPDASMGLDYGVPPEPDAAVAPEYGFPPQMECEDVCCECEYGVIPPDVWAECCEPDPCVDACCECDYGEPPPPECCD